MRKMKITTMVLFVVLAMSAQAQSNWYVDSSATGANNGSSWTNAFRYLSDAAAAAQTSTTADTIFVAKGTYYPNGLQSAVNTATRDTAFLFTRSNLAVLGGYPNGGGVRDIAANPTTLSGRVNADTTLPSYHVIVCAGTSAAPLTNTLVLDGFKITQAAGVTTTGSLVVNTQPIPRNMGAGMYNIYASPRVSNNIFTKLNSQYGAGIYNRMSAPRIINNVINGSKTSAYGSGICNYNSSPVISGCVLSGNVTGTYTGVIFNESLSSPWITNVTISGNSGAGIANSSNSGAKVKNCIIYNNASFVDNYSGFGTVTFSNCILQGTEGNSSNWSVSNGTDLGNNINVNPAFVTSIFNPGAGGTPSTSGNFQLKTVSPAIGKGDTAGISQYLPATDFLGNPRFNGLHIDRGAYEFLPTSHIVYVDSSATAGNKTGDSWAHAFTSLSYATNVMAAEFASIDTILIARGTYYPSNIATSTVRDSTFLFARKNLAVLGGYPSGGGTSRNWKTNRVILNGKGGATANNYENMFHAALILGTPASPIDSTLVLDGLTMTRGYSDYSSSYGYTFNATINGQQVARGQGGGLHLRYASAVIRNCSIEDNNGDVSAGVYFYRSAPLLVNTSVIGNYASYAGGISSDSSQYRMVNCVVSGNRASNVPGGIRNRDSDPTFINTTIAGNSSYGTAAGAVMSNYRSNPVIKNSIVYGNSTGILNTESNPVISRSIVQNSGGSAAWLAATGIDSGYNLDADPNFAVPVWLSSSSTTAGNLQILIGSPAINAGDSSGVSQYLPATDMLNNPRIQGAQVDMGAFELEAPFHAIYVDSSAVAGMNNGKDWANAFTSLSVATHFARTFLNVDTILVAKGTYFPTRYQADTDRDASLVFSRSNLAVLGGYPTGGNGVRNSSLYPTVLSGNIGSDTLSSDNSYHVMVAAGTSGTPLDSTLLIDGFTITEGNANADTGSVSINGQSVFRRNGGGMANVYASPVLSNIIVTKNTANSNGGGIFNFFSSPVIVNSSFTLNTARNGGAIFDTASSPLLTSDIFRGNRATNNGGGIYNVSASSPRISGSLLSGNNAASNGGAILNSTASSPIIVNTTIASNFAVNLGGGIINLAASVPVIKSSIVYANNSGITNVSSNPVVSYSIMQDGGYPGSNNNINQNPLFQTPLVAANIPSLAGNFQLLAGSPAMNSGDTGGISQYLPAYDLIGFPRLMGSAIDRGAYEYVRALYVDSSVTVAGKGTSWTDAYKYLSDATQSVRNVHAIDTVYVARGTYYPTGVRNLTGRDTSFIFTRSGTVLMGGYPAGGGARDWVANPTVLSGDIGTANDSTDNAYHVLLAVGASSAAPLTNTLKIDGFTITGGNASNNTGTITVNGVSVPRNFGGGMLNYFASPSLSNVIITKNGANSGGGMYCFTASPAISNATISANKAIVGGGGLFNNISTATLNNVRILENLSLGTGGGIATNNADLIINNSVIQDNKATTAGGGIHVNLSTPAFAITNTSVEGNTALTSGGGMYITNTSNTAALTLDNSKLNRNTAGNNGGGIANFNAAPTIRNSRISGNTASAVTTYNGGGISNVSSSPVVVNSVITGNKAANGGGMANSSSSAAKIINTVLAGNNATNGGGVYNQTGANPQFKNCIIAQNNTGVVNSTASIVPKPAFSYSIIQGSGGSGSGWVLATGIDSGFNKMARPNFVSGNSFTTAPDTSGNYSITICSPAVNMGDTTHVGQYIPILDFGSSARFNGKIDAGAYEIDSLSPASMYVPLIGGIYTSDRTFQQGNLTHFCNCDSNTILVTLDTFGTGVVLNDTSAKVRAGTAVAAYYQAGSGFVTNPNGTAIFNREWAVLPVAEPTSPVTVYTYYTDSDYVSVNNVMNSLMLPPLVSDTQMYFYKVTDTSLGLFPSIFNISSNQVQIITYGTAPSVDHWVAGALGSIKYAKYKVSSFSGGGGGGTSESSSPLVNIPLPLEILYLTGKKYPGYNLLAWNISEGVNAWELERSINSVDFKVLSAGGKSTLSYKDEHPEEGVCYYRLKVSSVSGNHAYSPIVVLKREAIAGTVTIFPIPAANSVMVHCSEKSFIGQKVTISDNVGRIVQTMTLQSRTPVDISEWAPGMYHLKLPNGTSIKMLKE